MYPRWTGTYTLRQIGTVKRRRLFDTELVPLFLFQNDTDLPLTLWKSERKWYQPFRTFDGFDFGSVPLLLQGFVSPLSAPKSFVLHDSNYEFHHVWGVNGCVKVSRKQADDLLLLGMQAEGCNWWQRNKVWTSVRIGGGGVWKKDFDSIDNAIRGEIASECPEGTLDERLL